MPLGAVHPISVIGLLGLDLPVPDHSTLSRRAETLEVPRLRPRSNGEPVHLLVDSTGLRLCGPGEWLVETACCMGRRIGRTEPYPGCGSRDADVLRSSEVEHAVQGIGGNGHLGRLSPIRLGAQPAANDAFPARDIGLHQSTPVVPRGPLPTHAAALGNTSQM